MGKNIEDALIQLQICFRAALIAPHSSEIELKNLGKKSKAANENEKNRRSR